MWSELMADPDIDTDAEGPTNVILAPQDLDPVQRTIDDFLNPLREVVEDLRSAAAERHKEFSSRAHTTDSLRLVAAGEAYQLATAADLVATQVHDLDSRLRTWIEAQQALGDFHQALGDAGVPLPASLDTLRAQLASPVRGHEHDLDVPAAGD